MMLTVAHFYQHTLRGKGTRWGFKLTPTHLLRNHSNTGSLDSTTKAGNGEELVETDKHIARMSVS